MKKILLIIVVLLLLVGGGAGYMVFTGKIYVKGVTPKPKPKIVASKDPKGGFYDTWTSRLLPSIDNSTAAQKKKLSEVPKPKPAPAPKPDFDKGNTKLAALWNAMSVEELTKITDKWETKDLAKILVKMEEEQVSKYIAALPADRGQKLSEAVRLEAATPPKTEPKP